MKKTEFLQELEEALKGEVSSAVIQENLRYYDNYISQEAQKGRTEDEVIEEIGGPRLIAKTIIDSSDAAEDGSESANTYYSGNETGSSNESSRSTMNSRYINLNKWYWKLLLAIVVMLVFSVVFTVLGGIFSLFFRFAGPIILIWLVFTFFKGMRR
ncbi:MAG: DUF1700 domain-containing protein [Clostridium sp.]